MLLCIKINFIGVFMIFADYEKLENLIGFTYLLDEELKQTNLKCEREAYLALSKNLGATHKITLELEAGLACTEYIAKNYEQAEELLNHSLNLFLTEVRIIPIKLFRFSSALFCTLLKTGKKEEALSIINNVIEYVNANYELILKEEKSLFSSICRIRTMLLLELNKKEEALTILEDEFKGHCLIEGIYSLVTFDSLILYIQALEIMGEMDIKERLIQDVIEAAKIEKPESKAMEIVLEYITENKKINMSHDLSNEDSKIIDKLVLHLLGLNTPL